MQEQKNMSPLRPHLFQAYLNWLVENEFTPYVIVDAKVPLVQVPQEHVKEGRIVLDLAEDAVTEFQFDHDAISFNAYFGEGNHHYIYLPMASIIGIHAQEKQLGTLFPEESFYKKWIENQENQENQAQQTVKLSIFEDDSNVDTQSEASAKPPKGRPHLRIIK